MWSKIPICDSAPDWSQENDQRIYLNVNLVVLRCGFTYLRTYYSYVTTQQENIMERFFCETEEKSSYVKHIAICVQLPPMSLVRKKMALEDTSGGRVQF